MVKDRNRQIVISLSQQPDQLLALFRFFQKGKIKTMTMAFSSDIFQSVSAAAEMMKGMVAKTSQQPCQGKRISLFPYNQDIHVVARECRLSGSEAKSLTSPLGGFCAGRDGYEHWGDVSLPIHEPEPERRPGLS